MSLRRWYAGLLVLPALLTACGGGDGGKPSTPEPTAQVSGVNVPALDPTCKRDVEDLSDPWITNGRLVALVDGKVETMTSAEAMTRSQAGENIDGVWLCPPA